MICYSEQNCGNNSSLNIQVLLLCDAVTHAVTQCHIPEDISQHHLY